MDWTQIEKDFKNWVGISTSEARSTEHTFNWFKQRIESELPPQPPEKLNEEERNEFYNRTDLTVDNIKVTYGK